MISRYTGIIYRKGQLANNESRVCIYRGLRGNKNSEIKKLRHKIEIIKRVIEE